MAISDRPSPDLPPPPPYDFVSAAGRTKWFVRFAWMAIVANALGAVVTAFEIELLGRIDSGNFTDSEIDLNETLFALYGVIALAVILLAMVIAFMWTYRVNKNSWVLRRSNMKFRPGWSVGWWFIPIANIFQPYRIIAELWRANVGRDDAEDWTNNEVSPEILLWWVLAIVGNVMATIYDRLTDRAETLSDYFLADGIFIISSLTGVVMWYISIRIVRAIQAGQERLAMTAVF
jgi:hypothetical protein